MAGLQIPSDTRNVLHLSADGFTLLNATDAYVTTCLLDVLSASFRYFWKASAACLQLILYLLGRHVKKYLGTVQSLTGFKLSFKPSGGCVSNHRMHYVESVQKTVIFDWVQAHNPVLM